MNIVKCKICGKEDRLHYFPDVEKDLMDRQLCFTCGFWDDKIKLLNEPNTVIIDNVFYSIDREEYKYPSEFRGFGGERFNIKFNDGREITTTNLWCCGTIPKHFRNKLPNNAIFIKENK
jgi:hypothetical protein